MLVPPQVTKTGLFVDARDDELRAVTGLIPLDLIQLHGKETPARVAEVRALTGLPVMMAIRLVTAANLESVPAYEDVADRLLFDSRYAGAEASGGPIDWPLLKGRIFKKPWLLAGGLTTQNLTPKPLKASGQPQQRWMYLRGLRIGRGIRARRRSKAFLTVAAALLR